MIACPVATVSDAWSCGPYLSHTVIRQVLRVQGGREGEREAVRERREEAETREGAAGEEEDWESFCRFHGSSISIHSQSAF